MTWRELSPDVVIVACGVSAGIHGALTRGHFHEGMGAGSGFAGATVLLSGLVVWLTLRPASTAAVAVAAAVLGGLLAAYLLAVTTGLPVLHPEPEPVETLALATKAIEALGLAAAVSVLSSRLSPARASLRPIPLPLTGMVACFSALAALAASSGHHV